MRVNWIFVILIVTSCERRDDSDTAPRNQGLTHAEPASSQINAIQDADLERADGSSFELQPIESLNDLEKRIEEIRMLGENGRIEAIPFLIENLTEITPLSTDGAFSDAFAYRQVNPCADALIRLGSASVPAIKKRILSDVSTHEKLVLIYTLAEIEGVDEAQKWIDELKSAKLLSSDQLSFMSSWLTQKTSIP